jgi:hypothetical protein
MTARVQLQIYIYGREPQGAWHQDQLIDWRVLNHASTEGSSIVSGVIVIQSVLRLQYMFH